MNKLDRVYFDNSATTPLNKQVAEEMQPYFDQIFGNPSSLHRSGRLAHQAVELARQRMAHALNAEPDEIIFTSGGTESDNLALFSAAEASNWQNCHIITSSIEHPAIMETCSYLQKRGIQITYLPVGSDGIVYPDDLRQAITPRTRLISIMAANNVVGTLQPIDALSRIAGEYNISFHTDAVQAFGKIPMDMNVINVDMVSISAHKLNGPKGIGALYLRKGTPFHPLINGGGQERGLRSGTENVAGIVGMGKAAEIASSSIPDEASRLVNLRNKIVETIQSEYPSAYLIGHRYRRLPGHICLGFDGQEGQAIRLMLALDEAGIEVSTGSACSANHTNQPSYILLAMGLDPIRARGSLRITLGQQNTETEVDYFLSVFPKVMSSLSAAALKTSNN